MSNGPFSTTRKRHVIATAALLSGALFAACYDFHLTGPEDPEPVPTTRLVNVSVEYRQQPGCNNDPARCDDPVVFFASWLRSGGEFALERDPTGFIWRGTALSVPVNYPPETGPYEVRVYDPHFGRGQTAGYTGNNIRIGRQILSTLTAAGTPREAAQVFIDPDGQGHNPF